MNWFKTLLSDQGDVSAKRVCMLVATLALAISVIITSIAGIVSGKDVAGALTALAWPLAALGGAAYVGGKAVESNTP
jgi:hypothetical protein